MRTKEVCACGATIDKARQSLELDTCEACAKKIPGNILREHLSGAPLLDHRVEYAHLGVGKLYSVAALEEAQALLKEVQDLSTTYMKFGDFNGVFEHACRFCHCHAKTPPTIQHTPNCLIVKIASHLQRHSADSKLPS